MNFLVLAESGTYYNAYMECNSHWPLKPIGSTPIRRKQFQYALIYAKLLCVNYSINVSSMRKWNFSIKNRFCSVHFRFGLNSNMPVFYWQHNVVLCVCVCATQEWKRRKDRQSRWSQTKSMVEKFNPFRLWLCTSVAYIMQQSTTHRPILQYQHKFAINILFLFVKVI